VIFCFPLICSAHSHVLFDPAALQVTMKQDACHIYLVDYYVFYVDARCPLSGRRRR